MIDSGEWRLQDRGDRLGGVTFAGGKPVTHFYGLQNKHYGNFPFLTVSVAPSGSRIRK